MRVLLLALAALIFLECRLSGSEEGQRFIEVTLPDSLKRFDPLAITMTGQDYKELLWTGALTKTTLKLRTMNFTGGDINIWITGMWKGRLAYHSNAFYTRATGISKLVSVLPPDTLAPTISWRGQDTVKIANWDPRDRSRLFAQVSCEDDRDIVLPVATETIGRFENQGYGTVTYTCHDNSKNEANTVYRELRIVSYVDNKTPVLTLRGLPSISILRHVVYHDSGAICNDAREGVSEAGKYPDSIADTLGTQTIHYHCQDSSGNVSEAYREVTVLPNPEWFKPKLRLNGPDTIIATSSLGWIDPGAKCYDGDGTEPLPYTSDIPLSRGAAKHDTASGYYRWTYRCQNTQGVSDSAYRIIKVGLPGISIPAIADALIDSAKPDLNFGGTGALGLAPKESDRNLQFPIIRFDLSRVDKGRLKSAKLHLFTFLIGKDSVTFPINMTFYILRMPAEWMEGTGDWYYHDGAFQNGGATWYEHYPRPALVNASSSNPVLRTGITGRSPPRLDFLPINQFPTRNPEITYFRGSTSTQVPIPENLTPVELDVTEYVLKADPKKDYGIYMQAYTLSADYAFGFASKELGNGSWAPRLMLEY